MKKFKKLIPAFCLLLVSAVLMGTSTFAWFSMNKTVTATGMQVTAKSDSTYLLIGDNAEIATAKTGLSNTVAAKYTTTGNEGKQCYPTAYYKEVGTLNGHATKADTWYTTSSDDQSKAVSGSGEIKEVTLGDKDYMLTFKMYLTLSQDSVDYNGKVKITPTFATADAAVKAFVVINGEKFVLDSATTNVTTAGNVAIKSTTALEVTVYVYVDGNSDNVNSNYINGGNQITGTLSLQFDID